MQQLIDKGLPIIDKHLNKKIEQIGGPKIKLSILGFVGILAIVVIICGGLIYVEKLESGNFTFLLGTPIGASITFLGNIIFLLE